MKRMRPAILLLPLLLLPACGTPKVRDFRITALDTGGREIRCLIEVNHRFGEAKQLKQYTPADIKVTFEDPTEPVPIKLHAVEKSADGKTERVPDPSEQPEYVRASRLLYFDDAENQLLIMVRNSERRRP